MQHIAEPFAGGRFRERFLNTVTALLKSALPPILIGGIVGYFGGLFKIKNEISDLRKGMFNKIEKRDEQHFNATLDLNEKLSNLSKRISGIEQSINNEIKPDTVRISKLKDELRQNLK